MLVNLTPRFNVQIADYLWGYFFLSVFLVKKILWKCCVTAKTFPWLSDFKVHNKTIVLHSVHIQR